MGHQGILIAVGIVPPGRFTEPVYGDDAARIAVQGTQQLELLGRDALWEREGQRAVTQLQYLAGMLRAGVISHRLQQGAIRPGQAQPQAQPHRAGRLPAQPGLEAADIVGGAQAVGPGLQCHRHGAQKIPLWPSGAGMSWPTWPGT